MKTLITALRDLTEMLLELTRQMSRLSTAQQDVAVEQRITNLIVRAQLTVDEGEKRRLIEEAAHRMDTPRRRSAHDPI